MKPQRVKGQALIEFALLFPLILFLMLGFFDLGRYVIYYTSLSNAVREATRAAVVNNAMLVEADANPNNNSLVTMVKDKAYSLHQADFGEISAVPAPANGPYETIQIIARYQFNPITPGIELVFGGPGGMVLEAQSKMWITPGSQ